MSTRQDFSTIRHGKILERLFNAAGAILRVGGEHLKFKMGMYSGEIVAGVAVALSDAGAVAASCSAGVLPPLRIFAPL